MDCCGHAHCHGHALTRRQWMWRTALSSVGAMLAGGVGPRGSTAAAQTAETASAALDVLRKSISVDCPYARRNHWNYVSGAAQR